MFIFQVLGLTNKLSMKWKESSKSNTLDSDQFEPDQSGLSQEEEDNLSKAMLHLLAHGNDYIYPPASSCSFGFPADDHALWFWAYYVTCRIQFLI
ncbi:hypothetical protein V6N13_123241 [Hibiscus sabdariffa]